jgi:hypothetical protein
MPRSILLATASLALFLPPSRAAEGGLDVPAGATVHFIGDSIFRGWGFGKYDDPSPLCRIEDICRLLAAENLAAPPRIAWQYPRPGENFDYGKEPGLLIKARIAEGQIGPDDWIVYEDAGPHGSSYEVYRKKLAGIAEAAAGARRRLIFMTMFDYNSSYPESGYDDPAKDVPSKTINDAIRDEGAARQVPVIDMNRAMDRLQGYLKEQGWGSTCHKDGVHPNVFGNLMTACMLLRSLGADLSGWKLGALETHFLHADSGGDVPDMRTWTWPKDPDDDQRRELVRSIRRIAMELPVFVR